MDTVLPSLSPSPSISSARSVLNNININSNNINNNNNNDNNNDNYYINNNNEWQLWNREWYKSEGCAAYDIIKRDEMLKMIEENQFLDHTETFENLYGITFDSITVV